MNPFELLKEDHRKVAELFDRVSATTARAAKSREKLFAEIREELTLHAEIEEQIFYPALRGEIEEEELLLEAYEEHRVVKRLLEEIEAVEPDDERWTAKVKVLSEYVKHHVKEEEGRLFKQARAALDTTQIRDLGDEILEAKELAKVDVRSRRGPAVRPEHPERDPAQRRPKQRPAAAEQAIAARGREREAEEAEEELL